MLLSLLLGNVYDVDNESDQWQASMSILRPKTPNNNETFRQTLKLRYLNLYLNKNRHKHSLAYPLLVVHDDKT